MRRALNPMTVRVMVLLCLSALCCAASGCGAPVYENIAEEKEDSASESLSCSVTSGTDSERSLFVYVCGAVRRTGVYELAEGARVYEALEAAGGLTSDAETASCNQAALLADGQQIYVPTKEEILKNPGLHETGFADAGTDADGGKVNINTADESALMTLKGIGQSRAEDIIQYRTENGPFGSIEEIMQVSGIKTAVFEKIRDDITVG